MHYGEIRGLLKKKSCKQALKIIRKSILTFPLKAFYRVSALSTFWENEQNKFY